jgi:hypothetical protein
MRSIAQDITFVNSDTTSRSVCPQCGYKLSKFRTNARCFNCDYKERGSDGPWAEGSTPQGEIWKAETIWDGSKSFSTNEYIHQPIYGYLKQRHVFDLASECDQLHCDYDLNRTVAIGSGPLLVARIWHVRKGFLGVHLTRIQRTGSEPPFERDQRRTVGACQGGGVWFGTVKPDSMLVVGEGIETTLSAMRLWNLKAGVATLGTEGLKSLVLPQAARQVVIAADNDPLLPDKKYGIGLRDARATRRLWLEEDPNIDVEIKVAPGPAPRDWNDVLTEQCHG